MRFRREASSRFDDDRTRHTNLTIYGSPASVSGSYGYCNAHELRFGVTRQHDEGARVRGFGRAGCVCAVQVLSGCNEYGFLVERVPLEGVDAAVDVGRLGREACACRVDSAVTGVAGDCGVAGGGVLMTSIALQV